MSLLLYKVFHILGLLLVFTALGGMTLHVLSGGSKENLGNARKFAGMSHGIGLILLLVSGFGMLARLGAGMEGWVIAKVVIWLFFGASTAVIWRKPDFSKALWFFFPLLGAVAGYLALYKPF